MKKKRVNGILFFDAMEKVRSFGIKHITITGGEPLLEENKEWMTSFIEDLLLEGFTVDIETNGADDVAVVITGEHSCMTARGIKSRGAKTKTATLLGKFKEDSSLRNEFYKLIGE